MKPYYTKTSLLKFLDFSVLIKSGTAVNPIAKTIKRKTPVVKGATFPPVAFVCLLNEFHSIKINNAATILIKSQYFRPCQPSSLNRDCKVSFPNNWLGSGVTVAESFWNCVNKKLKIIPATPKNMGAVEAGFLTIFSIWILPLI